MNEVTRVERRKTARHRAQLDLKVLISPESEAEVLEGVPTLNVSASGLYFQSSTWIEPMTKLALSFDVPVDSQDASKLARVDCEGLVVRVVPEQPQEDVDTYEVAVFFTTIDAESLHHLESFVGNRVNA